MIMNELSNKLLKFLSEVGKALIVSSFYPEHQIVRVFGICFMIKRTGCMERLRRTVVQSVNFILTSLVFNEEGNNTDMPIIVGCIVFFESR